MSYIYRRLRKVERGDYMSYVVGSGKWREGIRGDKIEWKDCS